jgi:hypothetical protein
MPPELVKSPPTTAPDRQIRFLRDFVDIYAAAEAVVSDEPDPPFP